MLKFGGIYMEKSSKILPFILNLIVAFFYGCMKGYTLFQIAIIEGITLFLWLQIYLYDYICIKRYGTTQCDEAKIGAWITGIMEAIIYIIVLCYIV